MVRAKQLTLKRRVFLKGSVGRARPCSRRDSLPQPIQWSKRLTVSYVAG